MLDDKTAEEYCMRLSRLRGFPRDSPASFRDMVLAMMAAETDAIAERYVTHVLDFADPQTYCPFPKDIRAGIYDIQEPKQRGYQYQPEHHGNCPECQDFGIVGGLFGGPDAEWCGCLAGIRRANREPSWVTVVNEAKWKLEGIQAKVDAKNVRSAGRLTVMRHASSFVSDVMKNITGERE